MWKITLIGRESSFNVTIQDILNQQSNYGCEIIHPDDLKNAGNDNICQDTDLIIADLTTHHYTPIKKIETIRKHLPNVPIIAIHLLENSGMIRDFTNMGVNKVLTPDLNEENLINAVHYLISEYY